jgi:mono/diheme cytochrome c family protein
MLHRSVILIRLMILTSTAMFTVAAMITVMAFAEDAAPPLLQQTLSPSITFSQQNGDALFANACQACHMEGGTGAVGAGNYPPLANNSNLEASSYPIHVVLHGVKSMPPMGKMMSDQQVAAVVNYVRTHFGNAYTDLITVQDVSGAR